MSLNKNGGKPEALLDEAAGWLLRLREAAGDQRVQDDFSAWLSRSSEHRAAWHRVRESWHLLGEGEAGVRACLAAPVVAGAIPWCRHEIPRSPPPRGGDGGGRRPFQPLVWLPVSLSLPSPRFWCGWRQTISPRLHKAGW